MSCTPRRRRRSVDDTVAVRPVVRLPEPILRTPAAPIVTVDEEALSLGEDLTDTMRDSPACVGLAAPQIGVGLQAFVIDVTGHRKTQTCHGLLVLFNPEIITADDFVVGREGCMSVPDLTVDVARATRVRVAGLGVDGTRIVLETDAFESRAVLHEIDHLGGFLILDRAVSSDGVFPRKVYH